MWLAIFLKKKEKTLSLSWHAGKLSTLLKFVFAFCLFVKLNRTQLARMCVHCNTKESPKWPLPRLPPQWNPAFNLTTSNVTGSPATMHWVYQNPVVSTENNSFPTVEQTRGQKDINDKTSKTRFTTKPLWEPPSYDHLANTTTTLWSEKENQSGSGEEIDNYSNGR